MCISALFTFSRVVWRADIIGDYVMIPMQGMSHCLDNWYGGGLNIEDTLNFKARKN